MEAHDANFERLTALVRDDPALAKDLLDWAERAKTVGSNGVFAAFRRSTEAPSTDDPPERVRLLRKCGRGPAHDRLYRADNLPVLRSLLDEGVSARCAYIDPPYGTQQQFTRKVTDHAAYCDEAFGAAYLMALRERIVLLRDLLDDEGSLFVHLDASMVAEVKLLLDEIFGPSNFRAWVSRRKCSSKNYTRRTFGDIVDYVLLYSKTPRYLFNRQFAPRTSEQEAIDFPKVDERTGRRFALVPLHAPGRRNGASGSPWRGMLPPAGKHWQWTPDKLDKFDARGDIYWTRNGTPRRKLWAADSPGSPMPNLWHDFRDPFNQNFATTGYPTQKNLDLLKLIVSAGSNPGDLVVDCYAGSGTTLAAAGALGRRWIGVDCGSLAIALAQKRLCEDLLEPTLLAPTSPGFELWTSSSVSEPIATADELDFGLLERLPGDGSAPAVEEVLKPGHLQRRMFALAANERLVGFDHGGREVVYESSASIQSIEKRPA